MKICGTGCVTQSHFPYIYFNEVKGEYGDHLAKSSKLAYIIILLQLNNLFKTVLLVIESIRFPQITNAVMCVHSYYSNKILINKTIVYFIKSTETIRLTI